MPEYLSPGIFIEEVPSSAQVIQGVSTSNMGVVGMAQRGPEDTATLVTSFDDYTRQFGDLIRDSRMGLSVAAFFANGGRRAYVVRVTRSDAVKADGRIQSQHTDESLVVADGTSLIFDSAGPPAVPPPPPPGVMTVAPLAANSGASPVVPGSAYLRWRAAGVALLLDPAMQRDGVTALAGDGVKLKFEGRINPASLPCMAGLIPLDPAQDVVASGAGVDVVVTWPVLAVPTTLTFLGATTGPVVTATNLGGSTGILDRRTGIFSLNLVLAEVPDLLGAITVDHTPAIAKYAQGGTVVSPTGTITITGNVNPVPLVGNFIDLNTGRITFQVLPADVPFAGAPILISYKVNAWALVPMSKGAWANSLRVQVKGNANYYTAATASYSRYDAQILLKNATTGVYEVVEFYEELDFTDPLSAVFFADVLNDLSDYLDITEPGGDQAPGELNGLARSLVLGGGDETAGNRVFNTYLYGGAVAERTLVITYTGDDGLVRTITDDGNGALIGAVDPTGTNTVVYATGQVQFTTVNTVRTIKAATLVTAAFRSAPAEVVHTENVGDTTKQYTDPSLPQNYYLSGSDGVAALSRNQISAPTLIAPNKGLYALSQVDEIMQVIIPDFPNDPVIAGDQIDYAELRKDRYIILTVPQGSSAQDAVNYFRFTLGRFTNFAAMYWPWVKIADPLNNNRATVFPPLGHIAGVYARTDINRNVGKSPGGTVDGQLAFLVGLERNTTQGDRDFVYPAKINPLIAGPQTGLAVWGVRQIALDNQWRYINARRLFMFCEKSVFNATHWIVFENNGAGLWARIKMQLTSFLNNLFGDGYFAGTKPTDAFFVICDETNNPQSNIDLGIVTIDVGIAPNKPAEFVRFRFQQFTAGA